MGVPGGSPSGAAAEPDWLRRRAGPGLGAGLGTGSGPDRSPGSPGRASPGPRLRPARPPQRREAGPRGRLRDARGGSPGSRRLGDWRRLQGAGAEARRSRGSGRPGRAARPGAVGPGREAGTGGAAAARYRLFTFLKQDVGRPADVMGSGPAPSPCREGEGRRAGPGAGGDPKGVSSATRGGKEKVIVKLETH